MLFSFSSFAGKQKVVDHYWQPEQKHIITNDNDNNESINDNSIIRRWWTTTGSLSRSTTATMFWLQLESDLKSLTNNCAIYCGWGVDTCRFDLKCFGLNLISNVSPITVKLG